LERVAEVEQKLGHLSAQISSQPRVDPAVLMQLASDLPFVWNAAGTDARARQRLVRLLIEEVVNDIDAEKNEFVLLLHWIGGRHTEVRLARRKTGRFPPGLIARGRRNITQAWRSLAGPGNGCHSQSDALPHRGRRNVDDRPRRSTP